MIEKKKPNLKKKTKNLNLGSHAKKWCLDSAFSSFFFLSIQLFITMDINRKLNKALTPMTA